METEIWKPIDGWKGRYEVSNLGRARSLYFKNGTCEFYREKIIGGNHSGGYKTINLNRKGFYIHRLIAEVFIPNPENKPHINHINSVRDDNRVDNLEWVTQKENNIHGYKYGNHKPVKHTVSSKKKISKCHRKLSDEDIKNIFLLLNKGNTQKNIANMYGLDQSTISDIKNRKYLYLN